MSPGVKGCQKSLSQVGGLQNQVTDLSNEKMFSLA